MGYRRNFSAFNRFSLLTILLWLGCGEPSTVVNLNGGKVDVIGHGGAGLRSCRNPLVENSITSIKKALDGYRTDGVEVDVQLTADGVAVLFHDARLEQDSDCRGVIYDLPLHKLSDCRLEHAFSFGQSGDRILTLDEAFAYFAGRTPKPHVYLDVKAWTESGYRENYDRDYVAALASIIAKHDAYAWVSIQSGRMAFLHEAKKRFGERVRLLFDADSFEQALVITASADLNGFVIAQELVERRHVHEAHRRGLWVVLYNVQSALSARHAADCWPDAVQADNIRVMQAALD
jgi:glycerophosphoryl diester phosphodiesterase